METRHGVSTAVVGVSMVGVIALMNACSGEQSDSSSVLFAETYLSDEGCLDGSMYDSANNAIVYDTTKIGVPLVVAAPQDAHESDPALFFEVETLDDGSTMLRPLGERDSVILASEGCVVITKP